MWTLSGFADEISPDLQEQCRVLLELGMTSLELRSAWGTNVSDLDQEQLTRVASTLHDHGIAVTCIGSPIGTVPAGGDVEEHRARHRRCVAAAQRLGSPYARVFSFFTDAPERDRDAVLRRTEALTRDAERAGVVLVHENGSGTYGNDPQRCLDLVESVGSSALRLTWDPANFVAEGVRPFDGVLSLEPHLGRSATGTPFSGPQLFAQARAAFTDLLGREGVPFR